ncbi:MAG TPA: phytanoyl-CoA dioxygenase family protein [Polyangia bacterium]
MSKLSKPAKFDLAQFEADGFAVIKGAVDPHLIGRIREEWEMFNTTTRDTRPDVIPKDQPAAVFWRHVPGEKKRIRPISEFPTLHQLAVDGTMADIVRQIFAFRGQPQVELRLLETIIFNKPPVQGTKLEWHQDNAYFPFEPNSQCALWIPLDPVDPQNGSLSYACGSHKLGRVASRNLHTGETFKGDTRPTIPEDPATAGYKVVTVELEPGDLTVHDGGCWHCSMPNRTDRPRRSLSLRYLVGETIYAPTPGSAATFVEQVDVRPGDRIEGPAFPVVA